MNWAKFDALLFSTAMERILSRIGVGLTLLLTACGGRVGVEGGEELDAAIEDSGTSDVATDAIWVDTSPGACGVGTCTPGTTCSPDYGCNTCSCNSDGSWACTLRDCFDAGPPLPPSCPSYVPSGYCSSEGQVCAYPNGCGGKTVSRCSSGLWQTSSEPCVGGCPASQPVAGTYCTGVTKCPYPNGCGSYNTAWCDGKLWHVEVAPCTTPSCPTYLPKPGTPCPVGSKCTYASGCPSPNTAVCETGVWNVYYADCPPPPPPTCPTSKPAYGSPCSTGMNCQWDNGCGNIVYGYCSGGAWMLKEPGCTPGCPGSKPTSGSACKSPSSTSCSYMVPGTTSCTSQCFCADDYRWACVTPPCASYGAK